MSQATLSPSYAPAPDGETLYEVVDGQRVEKHVSAFETMFATRLALKLGRFLDSNPLGEPAVEMLFLIDAVRDLQRRPDMA